MVRKRAKPRTDTLARTETDRELRRLTAEIRQLQNTALRDLAESIVEIGRRLIIVREKLPHGAWLAWLAAEMPFSDSAALNYMKLADWARDHPGAFQTWKHLGPTKLYALETLNGRARRVLREHKSYGVPGTDRTRTLERMSVADFYLLIAKMRGDLPTEPPIARIVDSHRRRIRGLVGTTEALIERKSEVDRDDAREFRDALAAAVRRLERAFRLR